MRSALHVIAGPGPVQLATMAHPRGEPWSQQELTALARAGVHVLVCAASAAEQHWPAWTETAAAARAAGLELVPFPVSEGSAPRQDAAQVAALAARLADQVRSGRFVVTQSFGGIGRSSLLATLTLVLLGIQPGEALRRTGNSTDAILRDWLHDFVSTHR